MGTTFKKYFSVITAILLAVLLCGCNKGGTPDNTKLTKQQAQSFLSTCRTDVDTIRHVIDETSDFLENATLDNQTQIQNAMSKLQSLRDELAPALAATTDSGNSAVLQYNRIKQVCGGGLDDVLSELQGILDYETELLDAFAPMSEMEQIDYDDLEAAYTQLGQTFNTVNDKMKAIQPPTFIQYMHEGMRSGMNDYLNALQFLLASTGINDPLRINSGEYQLGVIERRIDSLTSESEKGFDRRQKKIEEDVAQIEALLEGMDSWVKTNTDSLQNGGAGVLAVVSLSVLPQSLEDLMKEEIHCTYEAVQSVIPANYRSLDYVVYLSAWCDNGSADVIVSVEIPEFTQKFEQKVSLTRAETQIKIHPPLLEGAAKSLNSSKDAQISIKVTDADSGKVVIQETKPLKLYSRYDMQWGTQDGTPYYENVLAWVTPEAPEVKDLLRNAADSISALSDGKITFIGGYQSVTGYENADVVAYQAAAVMNALADAMDVKYVATPFSSSSNNMQRVATPSEVISKRSGLCIETAVTVASALQSTNMHAALIILPTHAQVAVETWQGSGEYYIIETTALDDAKKGNYDSVLGYLTKEEWANYIEKHKCTIIDCDLAQTLGIQSID